MATIVEAAEAVLERSGRPMHVRDICGRITEQGLYTFRAKDPLAALTSALYTHCAKEDSEKPDAVFSRVSKGVFGLASWGRG